MSEIIIENPRIVGFFKEHPNINPTDVMLTAVEMLDHALFNTSNVKIQEEFVTKLASFEQNLCKVTNNVSESMESINKSTENNDLFKEALLSGVHNGMVNLMSLKHASFESALTASTTRILDQISARDAQQNSKSSQNIGKIGESQLESALNAGFPSAEVLNTSGERASCDFKLMRNGKPPILIETKEYTRNVNKDEVIKFIRDIKECKTHGVFLSQHSGIANKKNFEINVIDGCAVVYVHNVEYSPEYIRIAVRVIDELHPYLLRETNDTEEQPVTIPKRTMQDISTEYSTFIRKKVEIIESYKKFTKTIIKDVENLDIPGLKYMLQTNCSLNAEPEKSKHECDYCKRSFNTKRGKQTHEKKCEYKNNNARNETTAETQEKLITEL